MAWSPCSRRACALLCTGQDSCSSVCMHIIKSLGHFEMVPCMSIAYPALGVDIVPKMFVFTIQQRGLYCHHLGGCKVAC